MLIENLRFIGTHELFAPVPSSQTAFWGTNPFGKGWITALFL